MDYANVFSSIADFFIRVWSVNITFSGYSFSVGALVIFCAIASVIIGLVKEMASK